MLEGADPYDILVHLDLARVDEVSEDGGLRPLWTRLEVDEHLLAHAPRSSEIGPCLAIDPATAAASPQRQPNGGDGAHRDGTERRATRPRPSDEGGDAGQDRRPRTA